MGKKGSCYKLTKGRHNFFLKEGKHKKEITKEFRVAVTFALFFKLSSVEMVVPFVVYNELMRLRSMS